MKEDYARAILRLIAVVTILVGAVLMSATLVGILGTGSTVRGAPEGMQVKVTGMVAEMGGYAVLSQALIAAWGVLLYFLSPKLAKNLIQ